MATFNWCDDKFCSWCFENSVDVIWEVKFDATMKKKRIHGFRYLNAQWEISYDQVERSITIREMDTDKDSVQDHQYYFKTNADKNCAQDHQESPKTNLGKDCTQDHQNSPKVLCLPQFLPNVLGKDCTKDHQNSPKVLCLPQFLPNVLGKNCTQGFTSSLKTYTGEDCVQDYKDSPNTNLDKYCAQDHQNSTKTYLGNDCAQDHKDSPKTITGKDCAQNHQDTPMTITSDCGQNHQNTPMTDACRDCAQDHNDSPKTNVCKDCTQDHQDIAKSNLGNVCEQDCHKTKGGKDCARDHQDCHKTSCSKIETEIFIRFQLCIVYHNEVLHKIEVKKFLRRFSVWRHKLPTDIFREMNHFESWILWCRMFRTGKEQQKSDEEWFTDENNDAGGTVLSENLKAALEDVKHSDVVLKLGHLTFRAHKIILSCRSKFFRAMFDHDTKENSDNAVDLVDMEEGIAKMMLQYIYTGKAGYLSTDNAIKLYSVADRYCLMELLTQCREFMVDHMDVDYVCDIATVADLHSDETLMKAVKGFFSKNVKEIIRSEKWRLLSESNSKFLLKLVEEAIMSNYLTPMPSDIL